MIVFFFKNKILPTALQIPITKYWRLFIFTVLLHRTNTNSMWTKNLYLFLYLFFFISSFLSAQISIKTDRNTAFYEAGEPMDFVVTTTAAGEIEYFIRFDNKTTTFKSGIISANTAGEYNIPFTLNEPGFVNCFVVQNGLTDNAAAAFSPFDIKQFEDEPSDFDAFWNAQKAALAAIPIDPVVTMLEESAYSTTYRVNLASIANRRVYGYLSVPKSVGPFPAILVLPSYGDAAGHVRPRPFIAEQGNALSFAISIHNSEPDVEDPNAYMPNEIDNRNMIYYKFALLAAVRAIDYLFTRDDFDGINLGVTGVSQGGGLSIATAGLDDRVKLLSFSIPALCQHNGYKYGRPSGHPHYLFTASFTPEFEEAATNEAIKYYDAINFAKRYHGPAMGFIAYEDNTCPPATSFAAYNQLRGHKVIQHVRDKAHDAPDYFTDRFDFWRKYFPKMLTPPSPFVDIKTGYHAEAGADQNISLATTANLAASVELNGMPLTDLDMEWEVVEGNGKVLFGTPNNLNTTVKFSKTGTYRIRFSANDNRFIDATGNRFTVSDDLLITVQ